MLVPPVALASPDVCLHYGIARKGPGGVPAHAASLLRGGWSHCPCWGPPPPTPPLPRLWTRACGEGLFMQEIRPGGALSVVLLTLAGSCQRELGWAIFLVLLSLVREAQEGRV